MKELDTDIVNEPQNKPWAGFIKIFGRIAYFIKAKNVHISMI